MIAQPRCCCRSVALSLPLLPQLLQLLLVPRLLPLVVMVWPLLAPPWAPWIYFMLHYLPLAGGRVGVDVEVTVR